MPPPKSTPRKAAAAPANISSSSPATLAQRYYRPELDAVRFLAFLLVFMHHSMPYMPETHTRGMLRFAAPLFNAAASAGRFGLSLFFTLSAFLICELLLRERQALGTVVVKQFYIRRILRIWPLYYLGLTLGLLVALLPSGNRADIPALG